MFLRQFLVLLRGLVEVRGPWAVVVEMGGLEAVVVEAVLDMVVLVNTDNSSTSIISKFKSPSVALLDN